jgi:hypothetical protein
LEEGILHPSAPFGPDIEGLPVQLPRHMMRLETASELVPIQQLS